MSQISVSIGCVTAVLGRELLHIAVDGSQLAPASIRPSLHRQGLRAKHITIPLKPRVRGPRAGWYWVHLTYPDGSHADVAWLHPDTLRETGQEIEAAFNKMLCERLLANTQEIDSKWLASEGYKLAFMWDDDFPAWFDTYFRNKSRHYRVSEDRFRRSVEDIWIVEPKILDVEEFIDHHPRCLQAISLKESKDTLFVWRFPWGPDGAYRWYASPKNSLFPADPICEALLRVLGPEFWDGIRTILIELGIPADYEHLDQVSAR